MNNGHGQTDVAKTKKKKVRRMVRRRPAERGVSWMTVADSVSNAAASSLLLMSLWTASSAARLLRRKHPVAAISGRKVKAGRVHFGNKWISLETYQRVQVHFGVHFNLISSKKVELIKPS